MVCHIVRKRGHGCATIGPIYPSLITGAGEYIATDQAPLTERTSANGTGDSVNLAVSQNGFVFISLAHNAAMFELCPLKVQPIAALETLHVLKRMRAECVLMALPGDTWRASKYEFFPSTKSAIDKLSLLTRSARKRQAELVAGLKPAFQLTVETSRMALIRGLLGRDGPPN